MTFGDIIRSFPTGLVLTTALQVIGKNTAIVIDWTPDDIFLWDLRQGRRIRHIGKTPGTQPQLLAFDGKYLWHTDFFAKRVYQLSLGANVLRSFSLPFGPVGIGFDGDTLWVGDFNGKRIEQIDLDGNRLRGFTSPGSGPRALLPLDGRLLHLDNVTARLYILSLEGRVIRQVATPASNPQALSFDGKYLWHTDWVQNRIYQLSLD